MFSSIGDAVLLTGSDGRIVEANAAATRLFGRRRDELLGLHSTDRLGPHTDIDLDQVRAAATAARQWSAEVEFTRPDGARRTSAVVVRPVLDDDGVPHGYLAVYRDITRDPPAAAYAARS